MEARSRFVLVLLTVCALGSGLLLSRLGNNAAIPANSPRLGAGYYVDNAELTGTGDDGQLLYRARTKQATEHPEDGSVTLDEVIIDYATDSDVPWLLSATAGRIPAGGKILQLMGDVVAVARANEGEPATIRTDFLELDPETFVAFTNRKVAIDYSGSEVFAVGMRAFLKEDRLQLLSKVNGKFIR